MSTKLTKKLEKLNVSFEKTDKEMVDYWQPGLCMTGSEETAATNAWKVYEPGDRASHYYYILKNNAGQTAIARYASVDIIHNKNAERTGIATICREIYALESPADIRQITIEQYSSEKKENSGQLTRVYRENKEKEAVWSLFKKNNTVYDISEVEDNEVRDRCPMEELRGKKWQEITQLMPENCYYVTIENKSCEKFIFCIVSEGEAAQVYMDNQVKNTKLRKVLGDVVLTAEQTHCVDFSKEEQRVISEWIKAVE